MHYFEQYVEILFTLQLKLNTYLLNLEICALVVNNDGPQALFFVITFCEISHWLEEERNIPYKDVEISLS